MKNIDYSPHPNNQKDAQIQPLARFGSIYWPETLRLTEMNCRISIVCRSRSSPSPASLVCTIVLKLPGRCR